RTQAAPGTRMANAEAILGSLAICLFRLSAWPLPLNRLGLPAAFRPGLAYGQGNLTSQTAVGHGVTEPTTSRAAFGPRDRRCTAASPPGRTAAAAKPAPATARTSC